MPSIDSQIIVRRTQASPNAISTGEIDELVKKVSETLKLKARQKQRAHKTSPYGVACKQCRAGTVCGGDDCTYLRHTHSGRIKKRTDTSKPHQLLEELLRQGNLINEAVARLKQAGDPLRRKYSYPEVDDHIFSEPPSPASL
ncbi:GSK-3-binding protein-like [Ptychodera flava]|uniref:GSK-3-binding protein-like n=1 Tax=Ptychodera flava TaxID=63121 RepID=UPI003969E74D